MAKKMKRMLALALVAAMCVTTFVTPTLAAEVDGPHVSDPVINPDNTQTVTTTTTVTDTADGKTTVVLTIEDKTTGTNTAGQVVDSTVTNTTTTITEGDTTQVIETEEGHETITTTGGEPAVDADLPDITLTLPTDGTKVDGSETSSSTPKTEGDVQDGPSDTVYDYYLSQSTIDRTASGSADKIEDAVIEDAGSSTLKPVGPEDYDGKSDMLYSDPEYSVKYEGLDLTVVMDKAPEGYDYIITGFQELINAEMDEVAKMQIAIKVKRDDIIFLKDEDGNLLTDEEGNYMFTFTKDINGGDMVDRIDNSPSIFALKKKDGKEGEYYFAYCIDADTETTTGAFYKLSNLEDSDYYATEDAAGRLRTIVENGYWGTDGKDEDGKACDETGNIQAIIDAMKAYYKEKDPEVYVQTDLHNRDAVEKVNFYDNLDGLTEAEALAATQAAIWMLANGSTDDLNGEDGRHIQYPTYTYKPWNGTKWGSWHEYVEAPEYINQYNDGREGTARMIAMMNWLLEISEKNPKEATDVVINEKNFVESFGITIKDKVEDAEANFDTSDKNDVYEADLNFTVAFVPDKDDNLLVYLYDKTGAPMLDKNGDPVVKRLATANGEAAVSDDNIEVITPVDGVYTLTGLELQEGNFDFNLQIKGTQILDEGVYIYTAAETSQTLVGIASGSQDVNVTGTYSLSFEVDETEKVVAEHHWRTEGDPITEGDEDEEEEEDPPVTDLDEDDVPKDDTPEETEDIPDEDTPLDEIPEEDIPLADVPLTGDTSLVWALASVLSGSGLLGLAFAGKKKEEEEEA